MDLIGTPVNLKFAFLGKPTVRKHNVMLKQFSKICTSIRETEGDDNIILGSPIAEKVRVQLLASKPKEMEKNRKCY